MNRGPLDLFRVAMAVLPALAGCVPASPDDALVTVTDVTGLEAPVVPQPGVYKLADVRPIPANGDLVASFSISFAAHVPDRMAIQLVSSAGTIELKKLGAPVPLDVEAALQNDRIASLLVAGVPVFWITNESSQGAVANILLPQTLVSASAYLRLFVSRSADETPIGGESVELAKDFFYVSVIGDSVAWGNGLFDEHKYSRLVSDEIQRRTGKRVIRQVHAISGATILPGPDPTICPVNCNGEAQIGETPILNQIDLIVAPDHQDLILMDGCINDVSVSHIIDPNITNEDLVARTNLFCGQAMAQELAKVRAAAPQARLAVMGYYPIVGPMSDPPPIVRYILLEGGKEPVGPFVEKLSANSMLFLDTSNALLAANVASVNTGSPDGPVAVFVSSEFTPDHSVFTPDPWLWGLSGTRTIDPTLGENLDIFPEDENAWLRASACFSQQLVVSTEVCVYASLGHPNQAGAAQFATRIIAGLETLGVLPAQP